MVKDNVGTAAKTGLGFGAVLAMIMSWTLHQSVIWVLIHGLLGWIYVVYYLLTKEGWSWF
jgi:hypothetical protein